MELTENGKIYIPLYPRRLKDGACAPQDSINL